MEKKLISILILFLAFIFYKSCFEKNVRQKSYYEVSMSPLYNEGETIPNIEEVYIGDNENLIIKWDKVPEGIYLKNIMIIYKNEKIGNIIIEKRIYETINSNEFTYSFKDDLVKILGKENENYKISSEHYMEDGFIFYIVFEDKKNNIEYKLKREVSIIFRKKGENTRTSITDF